jgi:two-component system alkaline phosphatase synthesis response regulator PhoP
MPTVETVAQPGILVVDDDVNVLDFLQVGLQQQGFRVWRAENAAAALELYQKQCAHIAVVLLDVCMPQIDGPQLLTALQELSPQLSCCFMSGGNVLYSHEELHRRGAAHIFAKPLQIADLAEMLRQLANRPSNLESKDQLGLAAVQ